MRSDGRRPDELRPLRMERGVLRHAEGSCLIEMGGTRVLCAASLEEKVPPFRRGSGSGWVTAEYGMLPRSTAVRTPREISRGKLSGRTQEIQRLIGRALRAVVHMDRLGERTIWIDCDVLDADGGTRTAAITGAFVALADALWVLRERGLAVPLLRDYLAAISVGVIDGEARLDLHYEEDVRAEVDMNVVMTARGDMVEVQGTGESHPFSRHQLDQLLNLAQGGIGHLVAAQRQALSERMSLIDGG